MGTLLSQKVIGDDAEAEADAPGLQPTTIARVWAPDCSIKQLTGPFAAYSTFRDLPRAMRVAPDVKTWAAVELWRWWAAPTHVGEDAVLRASTDVAPFFCCDAVWGSSRAERHRATVPRLPEELWLYTFRFFKHPEAPTSLHLIAFVALGKDHVVSEGEPIRSVR